MKIKTWHLILFGTILTLADQIFKIWIKLTMTIGEEIPVIGKWFRLCFIENNGAAYGMALGGDTGKLILTLVRIAAITALIIYIGKLRKKDTPTGVIIGILAITIGALGNLLDSLFYGAIFSESTFTSVATLVPFGEGYAPMLFGKVVDMLYFPIIDIPHMPKWFPLIGGERYIFFSPVFNLADSYITVSVIYLIIFQRKFFSKK